MTDIINNKVAIESEMKKSYLDYAMSVIISRAIPDIYDGLKPVHRRILYAMYEGNYNYNKPFKKSARIVGEVMGKYHPHGDSAIYDALVRLAQDFSMSLPLIDGQGNFGSIDDDPPAAMRYTESRLKEVANYLLEDLEKDAVDFVLNYDDSEKEPTVMPARFPNLLVNGSNGIAVGMATNIPPHNLSEVIDGVVAFIENNDISLEEIIKIIPAPDFPTGGIIVNNHGYQSIAKTGRGAITLRAKYHIETNSSGKEVIVITEIPYQTNKAKLVEKISELTKEKKIEGISDLRDESDRLGIRIILEIKKNFLSDVIVNQLFNYTALQSNFNANVLALNNGIPELLPLLDIIKIFTKFRKNVVTRRTKFLLGKSREKAHLTIGMFVAVNNIDEVVELIKTSQDTEEAKNKLLDRSWYAREINEILKLIQDEGNLIKDGKFYFTEKQAKAILELRLSRLTNMEKTKIHNQLMELAKEIEEYLSILSNDSKLMNIIKEELAFIKEKFGIERRSKIEQIDTDITDEDLIPKEEMVVTITMNGYIKRVPLSSYKSQKRGGVGKSSIKMNEEDYVTEVFIKNTHSIILFFSDKGKVYQIKTYKIPLYNIQSKGRALVNLIPLDQGEKISTIMSLPDNDDWEDFNMVFITSRGNIRKSSVEDFINIKSNGKNAIKLGSEDELVNVSLCKTNDNVLLSTKLGKAIHFSLENIRVIKSRSSSGIKAINLEPEDKVISSCILNKVESTVLDREIYLKIPIKKRIELKNSLLIEASNIPKINNCELDFDLVKEMALKEQFILTITEGGYGKKTSSYEYRVTKRGGKGIFNISISKKNGNVLSSFAIENDDQVILVTTKGTLIRINANAIAFSKRRTQGVILIKTKNEKVMSVAKISEGKSLEKELNDID